MNTSETLNGKFYSKHLAAAAATQKRSGRGPASRLVRGFFSVLGTLGLISSPCIISAVCIPPDGGRTYIGTVARTNKEN